MDPPRYWIIFACLNGLMAVGMGAYGAHGFDGKPEYLANGFNVGVQYQMWHALALLGVAWASKHYCHILVLWSGVAFGAGIALFSGTLYIFGITGILPMAGMAPAGGMGLMTGWVLLATGVWRGARTP